jgi:hypothetical protein
VGTAVCYITHINNLASIAAMGLSCLDLARSSARGFTSIAHSNLNFAAAVRHTDSTGTISDAARSEGRSMKLSRKAAVELQPAVANAGLQTASNLHHMRGAWPACGEADNTSIVPSAARNPSRLRPSNP